ncbi:alpha/beta fold hydrolase [Bordetella muralis]|uniref:alpha/beta fold hydrolase n=1 Tax=Bordetella muralis TaxID=1649130 RepID=UPI0039F137D9
MMNTSNPAMPSVKFVETNGIRMAVYEDGPANGRPVVLLHGFPELAYSWRHQIPALAEAGYRVIAPDLRGYGLTSCPPKVEDYDLEHLMDDLIGLLDALSIEKAIWFAHDWGGILGWQLPLFHHDRTAGVIGVNTPFIPHWQLWLQPDQIADLAPGFVPDPYKDPIEQMRQVYCPEMYVLMFQNGGVSDKVLDRDPRRTFQAFFRKNGLPYSEYRKLPPASRNMDLLTPLARLKSGAFLGDDILTPEELNFYADRYANTGFTPGINWYRNISRNWKAGLGVDQTVRVPSLMISGEDDPILTAGMASGMRAHVPDLESQVIPRCGHWTQEHKPDKLNALALNWLARRFPSQKTARIIYHAQDH